MAYVFFVVLLIDVQVEQKMHNSIMSSDWFCNYWSDVCSHVVVNAFYSLKLEPFGPASTIALCLPHATPTLLRRML